MLDPELIEVLINRQAARFTLRWDAQHSTLQQAATALPAAEAEHQPASGAAQQIAGELWEFSQTVGNRPECLIVGASGFSPALARQAELLGYRPILIEPRQAFAQNREEFAHIICQWPGAAIAELSQAGRITADTVIVVCTHDERFDVPALLAACDSPAGYIGAVGSRCTTADRARRLHEAGLSEQQVARIHGPAGLDIGSASPAQIAVAIFAEVIASQHQRPGVSLQLTSSSIQGHVDKR